MSAKNGKKEIEERQQGPAKSEKNNQQEIKTQKPQKRL